jgi:hypothetical protein
MALYREQLEPHMYSDKKRKRKSYKWAKKQMNKWLRIKNKKIDGDDVGGHGKKQWYVGNSKIKKAKIQFLAFFHLISYQHLN